ARGAARPDRLRRKAPKRAPGNARKALGERPEALGAGRKLPRRAQRAHSGRQLSFALQVEFKPSAVNSPRRRSEGVQRASRSHPACSVAPPCVQRSTRKSDKDVLESFAGFPV